MPLRLPLVGEVVSKPLGNYFAGAAGLMLVFSSLLRRWLALGLSLLAAVVFAGQFLVAADVQPQLTAAEAEAICAAEEKALDTLTGERHLLEQQTAALENPFQITLDDLEKQARTNPGEEESKRIRRQIGKFQRELEAVQKESAEKFARLDADIARHKARLAAAKQARDPAGTGQPAP